MIKKIAIEMLHKFLKLQQDMHLTVTSKVKFQSIEFSSQTAKPPLFQLPSKTILLSIFFIIYQDPGVAGSALRELCSDCMFNCKVFSFPNQIMLPISKEKSKEKKYHTCFIGSILSNRRIYLFLDRSCCSLIVNVM